MERKLNTYKLASMLATLVCLVVFVVLVTNESLSVIFKVVAGFLDFFCIIGFHAYYLHKVDSLRCPNCQKNVMSKAILPDQSLISLKPYERCYFCGHEFD